MNPIKIPLPAGTGERIKVRGALRAGTFLVACLLSPTAYADILLDGHQHIGDSDSLTLQPGDPVTRRQHSQSPTNFHLSADATITAVQLNGLAGTVDPTKLKLRINGNLISTTFSGDTLTLTSALGLPLSGNRVHTLALDPGCTGSTPPINQECPTATGNDIGFSSIRLISAQTTTSTNLTQRRHVGVFTSSESNNYGPSFYPDMRESTLDPVSGRHFLEITFTLTITQRLTQVRFFRLRDVNNNAQTRARVLIDGMFIGDLSRSGDPFRINTNQIITGGAAGTHTLRVEAGVRNGIIDDISWDEIHLLYTFDPSLLPGGFNAVEVGDTNVVSGRLKTKISGSSFAVDLYALNQARDGVDTTFAGDATVELLDASNNGGLLDPATSCRSTWSTALPLGPVTFVAGRKTLDPIVYNNALRIVRFKVTNPLVSGCSTDAFAIRPDHFELAVSDTDPMTPGLLRNLTAPEASYSPNFQPTHRAGRPFSLTATAKNLASNPATNYDGQPSAAADRSFLGINLGVVSADNWSVSSGVAYTENARYSEVGAFVLIASDSQFAAIDVDDTPVQDRTATGQINVGRFTPDNFGVSLITPEFQAGCTAFTYTGQPFNYAVAPMATLTAINADGTTTLNYTGNLYKLPGNVGQSSYQALDPATGLASSTILELGALPSPDNTVTEAGNGQATVTLNAGASGIAFTRNTPAIPFDAEIAVTLASIVDSEGIAYSGAPITFGGTAAGTGIAFTDGAKEVRFGRLVLDNAYGSERLPLDVPLRAEYWASSGGGSGFVHNLQDNCTTLNSAQVAFVNPDPSGLTTSVVGAPATLALISGRGNVPLAAPGEPGKVTVRANLSATVLPWLRWDWDGGGTYDDSPSSQASFGLFKNNERRIYQREIVR